MFYKLVFERVSLRYVGRIVALAPERPCFFSFLSVRGYLTMALMVTLGVTLRTSGLMPLGDLGSLYLAVGLPLGLCSVHYFRQGFFLL